LGKIASAVLGGVRYWSPMALETVSASTMRNVGQQEPPISISSALSDQSAAWMTGMLRAWPFRVGWHFVPPVQKLDWLH